MGAAGMSEEAGQADATEQALRYAGLIAVGDQESGCSHAVCGSVTGPVTDAEREYNAQIFGQTYRERTRAQTHSRCIVLCLAPRAGRVNRCPSCYGPAVPMDIYMSQLAPAPGRGARFATWAGGVIGAAAGAFAEAVTFPFRVGRAHTAATVRDILQEAIGAGLAAEVDGLSDILAVLEAVEGELRAIRQAADNAGEVR